MATTCLWRVPERWHGRRPRRALGSSSGHRLDGTPVGARVTPPVMGRPCRRGGRARGRRRDRRDPQGIAEQVRVRPRAGSDPAGPDAVHLDRISGRLRVRPRHARRGRRPDRRARDAHRADVPGLPGPRPRHRRVLDARRAGPGRQAAVRPRDRPAAGAPAGARGRADAPDQRDLALLRDLRGLGARQVPDPGPGLGATEGSRPGRGGRATPIRRAARARPPARTDRR